MPKKAAHKTHNKRIGVIATLATINSSAYTKNIHDVDSAIKVTGRTCPLFVPLAEEGWFKKKVTFDIAKEYLTPMVQAKVDTLILGCTHYPLLRSVVQKVVGKNVALVDSAKEIAVEVKTILTEMNLGRAKRAPSKRIFYVSDQPQHFLKLARRFLGYDIKDVKRCNPCMS